MEQVIKRENSIFTSATLASTRIQKNQNKKSNLKKDKHHRTYNQNYLSSESNLNLIIKQNTYQRQNYQSSQDKNKKYISRRYNTVEGQLNRMKNKKYSTSNKTFSNQIYFPHNIKNIQENKNTEQSNELFHLNSSSGIKNKQRQVKSHQKQRKCLLSQIQQNNQNNVNYLTKLNQQKQLKIKQIYMPKGLNSFHIDAKKQYKFALKSIPKSKSQSQSKNNKIFLFSQVKNKPSSISKQDNSLNNIIFQQKKPFQKQKTQNADKISRSLNLKNSFKTEQEEFAMPIKNQIQFKKLKKLEINQQNMKKQLKKVQKLPRYTQFYNSFLTQVQIKPVLKQNWKKQLKSNKIQSKLPADHFVPSHIPTPIIRQTKNLSKTPIIFPQTNQNIYIPDMVEKQWVRQKFNPHLELLKNISDLSDFVIKKIDQGVYFGQIFGEKIYGLGVIFYQNGVLFQGNFINNEKSGEGYQLYPDGSFFLGNYQNNKKNGKGRFQWNNGQIYDGQWKNGKKHGSGLWKAKDISYVGQWKSNSIQGFGVLIEQNERYQGQFCNFTKHGHGTYRYSNGQVYNGMFKMNRLNGEGQYYWPNGDFYKGGFVNNKRHGKGTLKLVEGVTYNGQFRNDKKCGLGQQTYENQQLIYTGNFQNDLKHGWGTLSTKDRPIYSGYFVNNRTLEVSETPSNNSVIDQEEQFLKNDMSDKILNPVPDPQFLNKKSLKTNLIKMTQNEQKQTQKRRNKHLKSNYYMKRIVQQKKNSLSKERSNSSNDSKFKRAFKYLNHK